MPETRNLGVHLPLGSLVLGSLLGGLFGVVVDSLVGSSCLLGTHNHKGGAKRPAPPKAALVVVVAEEAAAADEAVDDDTK